MQYNDRTYTARILEYGVGETKKKQPQIMVRFGYTDPVDDHAKTITWYGHMTEAAAKYTIEKLVTMGLKGELDDIARGMEGGALNADHEYEIVVEAETYEGKTADKVKFINLPGFRNAIPQTEAKASLAKFKGLLTETRKAMGVATTAPRTATGGSQRDEDIPF